VGGRLFSWLLLFARMASGREPHRGVCGQSTGSGSGCGAGWAKHVQCGEEGGRDEGQVEGCGTAIMTWHPPKYGLMVAVSALLHGPMDRLMPLIVPFTRAY